MSCIDSELVPGDDAAAVIASIEPCADQELVGLTDEQILDSDWPASSEDGGSWVSGVEGTGDGVVEITVFTFAVGRAVVGAWPDHEKVIVCWAFPVPTSGSAGFQMLPAGRCSSTCQAKRRS